MKEVRFPWKSTRRMAPAVWMVLGLIASHLLLRLPAALRWGPVQLLVPSVEGAALAAALAACARLRLRGRWIAASLAAALLEFLFLFTMADALMHRFFNRPLALATDWGYLPDLFALLRETAPRAGFVAGLALLPLGLAALGLALTRLFSLLYWAAAQRSPQGRAARAVLLGLCSAAAASGLMLPGARAHGSTALPRLAQELGGVLGARRYAAERREELRALAAAQPVSGRPLDRLEGRDVFLFIVESYGYTLYSEPEHFRLAEPFLKRMESRLEATGYRIVSNFLDSPAFGGNSWLADSTLAAGARIADQAAYEALFASQLKPMAAWFREAGYLTVNSMPAVTSAWPEGDFYRFERSYYFRDFGYRGPTFKWAPMTDQFAVNQIHRREVAPAARPLFVQFVMISGHYPFDRIPRYFEDWSELGDGSIYARTDSVQALPIAPGSATAGARGYAAAIEYQLTVVSEYLARFLAGRRALIAVVGDHQPYSGITGRGKLRSVPIHVLSREAGLLEPFLRRGYSPGLVPRQPPPHAGLESFLPGLLEDFSSGAEAWRGDAGSNPKP